MSDLWQDDPLDFEGELVESLCDTDLDSFLKRASAPTDAAPRRAAYRVAVALGQCRLFAIPLAQHEGSLPVPMALAAAQELLDLAAEWTRGAESLERRCSAAVHGIEVDDHCSALFYRRLQAWAAMTAVFESLHEQCESGSREEEELDTAFAAAAESLRAFDAALYERRGILASLSDLPLLQNWRDGLAAKYREDMPWILEATLDDIEASVAHARLPDFETTLKRTHSTFERGRESGVAVPTLPFEKPTRPAPVQSEPRSRELRGYGQIATQAHAAAAIHEAQKPMKVRYSWISPDGNARVEVELLGVGADGDWSQLWIMCFDKSLIGVPWPDRTRLMLRFKSQHGTPFEREVVVEKDICRVAIQWQVWDELMLDEDAGEVPVLTVDEVPVEGPGEPWTGEREIVSA